MTRVNACIGIAATALAVAANRGIGAIASGPPPNPIDRTDPFAALVARRSEIARVRVIHLATLVSTYQAIGPQRLEAYPGVTATRESGGSIDALLAHLRTAHVGAPIDATIDARWAFVFERADRSRVGSIYLDEFGRRLATADRTFRLEHAAGLFAWLHARFGRDGVIR